MPTQSKPLTLERVNDIILGSFRHVPPSETLDHAVRFLSTWSGSDKLFGLIQYIAKVLVPILEWRARMQVRAGLRKTAASPAAEGAKKLAGIIGDARMLWHIWGLLPIFQWLISLERTPPPTKRLQNIERLQGWAMLVYYPLDHIYYLSTKGLWPGRLRSPAKLATWSTRAWAVYVFLQFLHLREDAKLLAKRHKALRLAGKIEDKEKQELVKRKGALWNELIVNAGYLPLTVHWSLEQGLFNNEAWVGIFGLVAAVASFRGGWHATAPIVRE